MRTMRAGEKLVLTIMAALVLHWIFFSVLADPVVTGNPVSDPLVRSLFLNLVGIPLGVFLGQTGANRTAATFPGLRKPFVTVLFGWVFIFGFLAAPGLLIGKYVTDAIRESGDIPPPRPAPGPSSPPPLSYPSGRTGRHT